MTRRIASQLGRWMARLSFLAGLIASVKHGTEAILLGMMAWIAFLWAGGQDNETRNRKE